MMRDAGSLRPWAIAGIAAMLGIALAVWIATGTADPRPTRDPAVLRALPPIDWTVVDAGNVPKMVPASTAPAPAIPAPPVASAWDRRRWIDKAARLLRGGAGLGPDDDVEALLALSDEAIVRRFMADPRFGDTALDFNLFFLGFRPNGLRTEGQYRTRVFDMGNAVAAAQALLRGEDYFKLFDLAGPFYMAPLNDGPPEDPPAKEDAHLYPDDLRSKAIDEARDALFDLVEFGTTKVPPNGGTYCDEVEELVTRSSEVANRLYRAFTDAEVFVIIRGKAISAPLEAVTAAMRRECRGQPDEQINVRRLAADIQAALVLFDRAFAEMRKFETDVYRPQSVLDFKKFDLSAFAHTENWLAFGFEQGIALGNSSTNYNRKRAAYVLKRFFCDDLIPVAPETPQEHTRGVHGSDTSCFACHYKLDPMAGFFRQYGAYFYDYARAPDIIFDDSAVLERAEYEQVWRAPKTTQRPWNVGYVRSPRYAAHNVYGQSLADLSRTIRAAPEAKRCLMKRLFEYAVAEDQTIDGGFLDHLTQEFDKEAKASSAAAMKNAIVRVVTSRSFRERDADPKQCYDQAPGAKPEDAPPCRVAALLQKNCGSCHNDSFAGDGQLDLTRWVATPDGKARGFPHLDDTMTQRSAQATLTRMLERLSSRDPKVRMPKDRIMTSQDRQDLFVWAQQELARLAKGTAQ